MTTSPARSGLVCCSRVPGVTGSRPLYLLEADGFEVWLVNAKDVKHLPGRPRIDRLDALWLCKVAEGQVIRASFVPPLPIRRLRDLTRYQVALIDRTGEKNRVENPVQIKHAAHDPVPRLRAEQPQRSPSCFGLVVVDEDDVASDAPVRPGQR